MELASLLGGISGAVIAVITPWQVNEPKFWWVTCPAILAISCFWIWVCR